MPPSDVGSIKVRESRFASVILWTGLVIVASVSLMLVWKLQSGVLSWTRGWPVWMGVGVLGVIAFFLRSSPVAKEYAAIMGVSCVLALVMSNAYFLMRKSPFESYWVARGVAYDSRSKYDIYHDLRRQGVDVVPAILPGHIRGEPGFQDLLPLSGFQERQTIYCNELGTYAMYQSDKHGFRNPSGTWERESNDIALLGDSFVHGACIPDEMTIATTLRRSFDSVVNLGMGGSGPLTAYAIGREYLPVLRPKIVLWVHTSGILARLDRERKSEMLTNYLGEGFSQHLMAKRPEIEAGLNQFLQRSLAREESLGRQAWMTMWNFLLLRSFRQVYGLHLAELPDASGGQQGRRRNNVEFWGHLLAETRRDVEAWGGSVVVVMLGGMLANEDTRDEMQKLGEVVEQIGAPLIDVTSVLQPQDHDFPIYAAGTVGHYSPEAYRFAGEYIAAELQRMESVHRLKASKHFNE